MIPSPNIPCGYCGSKDWVVDGNGWACYNCKVAGRPVPIAPDFNQAFDFDNWYDHAWLRLDGIKDHLEELRARTDFESPVDQILHEAQIRKLEKEHMDASLACDIGSLIAGVKSYIAHGDIYFDLPTLGDIDGKAIRIRIEW